MNESNIKQEQQNSDKEIDLLDIGSKAWKGTKVGVKSLTSFLITILIIIKDFSVFFIILSIRKALWVITFLLAGVLFGYVYYNFIRTPYYTSQLEGNSGGVDNSVVINQINNIERMVGKPELLADFFNLTVEEAKQIRLLKACYGIDMTGDGRPDLVDDKDRYAPRKLNPQRDTLISRVPSIFYVKVQLYDESIIPVLRDRILEYINENEYVQRLYEIDKRLSEETVRELEKEIVRLDTLQMVDVMRKAKQKTITFESFETILQLGAEPEFRLLYPEIFALHDRKQELQRVIEIKEKPIIVVNDFAPAQYDERTQNYYVLVFGFIMVVIGYVLAILWSFRKKLRKIIMEEQLKYFENTVDNNE